MVRFLFGSSAGVGAGAGAALRPFGGEFALPKNSFSTCVCFFFFSLVGSAARLRLIQPAAPAARAA